MKSDYTVPITDKMRVKHGTQALVTVRTSRTILENELTPIETIGGALTRIGFMYNRLSMSGGVSWWNPANGKSIARPKVTIKVRPEDVLKEGENDT